MSIRNRGGGFRRRQAGLLAFALAGSLLAPGVSSETAYASPPDQTPAQTTGDPVANGSLSEEDKAIEDAKASGQPVELLSARTEASDTWAQPDGSFSVKRHGTAVRVWRNGAWAPTDPSLVFTADGSVVPRTSSVSVRFSGGGSGPMLTGVKDGRSLSLTWPKPLPKPTLNGNVATYPEVLAGVDLQLKAETEGFSQLLVVKTAEAAKNPELAKLQFAMNTVGLTVTKDAGTGALEAQDPAGQTVFTSPTPLMWDSSQPTSPTMRALAAEAPADAFEPGAGAEEAQMGTTVTSDSLTITPDQQLLTGAETTYPVYIDPSWAWGEWQHWARVYKAYPNTSFYDVKEVVRVGYEAETGGSDRVSRSFFQLDTSDVAGAQVKEATFRIRNTWSWSCQPRPIELWETGDISRKTTWANQPGKIGSILSTVNDAKGWSKDCAAGNLEFNATPVVRKAAVNKDASVTLGLYASNEEDTFGWKKFDPKTATLEIKYNHPPKTPTGLGTNPRTSCTAGGVIGNSAVSLYAKTDDPDGGNLTAQFQLFRTGSSTPTVPVVDTSLPALKGRVTTLVLPADKTPSGDYTWKVRARDPDGALSAWSTTCKFSLDRTRPSQPPLITSEGGKFPNGENGWPALTGTARSEGKFLFANNGVKDVVAYYWWTDTNPEVRMTPAGVASALVTPPSYGPHLVHAYSVDKAGNRSDQATYLYYANRAEARDKPGDLTGDGFLDIWSTDINGTLLTYVGQGNRDFSSATNAGASFPDQQVTYSGDWHQDGRNDLIALEYNQNDLKKDLVLYSNNGEGSINPDSRLELKVSCPVARPSGRCKATETWNGDDHWHNAEQITTGGDINADGMADLLVKQGKHLWAYYGSRNARLDVTRPHAILVGATDWDRFTVIVAGDLNADKLPDLLLREDASGDLYRSYGKPDVDGTLNLATWGSPANRVKLTSGTHPKSLYPTLGVTGDLDGDGDGDGISDGDGIPDLWGRKSNNTLVGWPGRKTGSDYTGIGAYFTIDGVNGGRHIPAGTTLTGGQSLASTSVKLTMQADGNLVITSNTGGTLWTSGTAGNNGATARVLNNGNLAVYSADGSTQLWSTNVNPTPVAGQENVEPGLPGTGYALLQDRGNLVVHNGKGQAVWSSGTHTRHDYQGDGRSDVGLWYDFDAGTDATYTLLANSDGTFNLPMKSYAAAAGMWEAQYMKFVTGDFNGDGRGDMAALRPSSDTSMKLWTSLGKTDGGFNTPFSSWSVPAGVMHASYMTPQAGDFNGDGRDDIAVWYAYPDGTTKLLTYTANVQGGFNKPFESWTAPEGTWLRERCKFVTGDFNGDGRDDLGVFYGQGDDTVRNHTFLASVSGGFAKPTSWWYSGALDWDLAIPHAGDFNRDGRDDAILWYDNATTSDKVSTIIAESQEDNKFGSAYVSLIADPSWRVNESQMVIGDYNSDGYDDIGTMYHQPDGAVKMWTWTGKPDGKFNGAKPSNWIYTSDQWKYEWTRLFKPYN
ncbi:FG-GAP-like repeat-containing protein [Streptomyces sp. NPDC047821]|uniref:FG-GAP-like repeat-containing protein n=1 Tax=Streptomyces sp. NPDC047821 TaxID=3365488 RepID=UPI003711A1FE